MPAILRTLYRTITGQPRLAYMRCSHCVGHGLAVTSPVVPMAEARKWAGLHELIHPGDAPDLIPA